MGTTGIQTLFRLFLVVGSVTLMAASCGGGTRDCPGFVTGPADAWTTVGAVGDSVTFRGSDGSLVVLALRSREDSTPYVGFDYLGSDQVSCGMTSTRLYDVNNGQAALKIDFRQIDTTDADVSRWPLTVDLRPVSAVGTPFGFGFVIPYFEDLLARYGSGESLAVGGGSATQVLTGATIGNRTYALAVQQRYVDTAIVAERAPDAVSAIVRVVFGEGAGLIAFERLDGVVYTRVEDVR